VYFLARVMVGLVPPSIGQSAATDGRDKPTDDGSGWFHSV
jgi:hypothetical protein